MGMHKYCSDPDPRLFCARSDPHSVEIVETCVTEIVEVTFEAVNPGKIYMCQPTIKTFLDETSLGPFVSGKESR
jgi:hypothetical protein